MEVVADLDKTGNMAAMAEAEVLLVGTALPAMVGRAMGVLEEQLGLEEMEVQVVAVAMAETLPLGVVRQRSISSSSPRSTPCQAVEGNLVMRAEMATLVEAGHVGNVGAVAEVGLLAQSAPLHPQHLVTVHPAPTEREERPTPHWFQSQRFSRTIAEPWRSKKSVLR